MTIKPSLQLLKNTESLMKKVDSEEDRPWWLLEEGDPDVGDDDGDGDEGDDDGDDDGDEDEDELVDVGEPEPASVQVVQQSIITNILIGVAAGVITAAITAVPGIIEAIVKGSTSSKIVVNNPYPPVAQQIQQAIAEGIYGDDTKSALAADEFAYVNAVYQEFSTGSSTFDQYVRGQYVAIESQWTQTRNRTLTNTLEGPADAMWYPLDMMNYLAGYSGALSTFVNNEGTPVKQPWIPYLMSFSAVQAATSANWDL